MRFHLLGLLALAVVPMYGGIVNNPSFEIGDITGWSTGGNYEFSQVVTGSFYSYTGAEDGNYYLTLGPVGSPASLDQTVADINGVAYTLSFWLNAVGDAPSSFQAYWNGDLLLDAGNPDTSGGWNLFSYSVIGTGSDDILFNIQDDPGYIALDNIQLNGGTVPEPATFFPLGAALLGLAYRLRRRSA